MINEAIFSEYFRAGNRTYFFDIKESKDNKRYISIVESKKKDGKFEKFKIMIFEEDIELFAKYFNSSLLKFFKNKKTEDSVSDQNKVKTKYPNAYSPWSPEEDEELEILFCKGQSDKELSVHFKRNRQ